MLTDGTWLTWMLALRGPWANAVRWIVFLGWYVVHCSTISSDLWTQQTSGQATANLRAASQPWLASYGTYVRDTACFAVLMRGWSAMRIPSYTPATTGRAGPLDRLVLLGTAGEVRKTAVLPLLHGDCKTCCQRLFPGEPFFYVTLSPDFKVYVSHDSFWTADIGWVVGTGSAGPKILYSGNGGIDWAVQNHQVSSVVAFFFHDVSAIDNVTAFVVGDFGAILYTNDAGQTWTMQSSVSTSSLYKLFTFGTPIVWAVGARGNMLKTTNAGATWEMTQPAQAASSRLSDVYFRVDGTARWDNRTVVSYDIKVRHPCSCVTPRPLLSPSTDFKTNPEGFVVGDDGLVLRTIDGGLTWQSQVSCSTTDIRGVVMTEARVGFTIGFDGH
eukprot:388221-Prorocentrum_minimum.AAC.3